MKIGVINSAWENMGNAFYAMALKSWLSEKYPHHEVFECDEPFRPIRTSRCRRNRLQLTSIQDVDVFVFSGPILAQLLRKEHNLAAVIKDIIARDRSYALLSVSAAEMSMSEISATADFLNAYPPILFVTRDESTYLKFKQNVTMCKNGICTAFLVRFLEGIPEVQMDVPYFISSFYLSPEPYFKCEGSVIKDISEIRVVRRRPLMPFVKLGYSRHFECLRDDYPSVLADHRVVRIHQGFNPNCTLFNYAAPNSFVSYNPMSYLSLYKSCNFVISDRVHACVAALSYGHPVRMMTENDRCGVFTRFNLKKDSQGIMREIDEEVFQDRVGEFSEILDSVFK